MADRPTLPDRITDTVRDVAELVPGPQLPVDQLELTGQGSFTSCFDVDTAALASAALANLSAGHTTVDRDRVVALFAGRVEVDGRQPPVWADLSGNYRTSTGGFIQFHCNFPTTPTGWSAASGASRTGTRCRRRCSTGTPTNWRPC